MTVLVEIDGSPREILPLLGKALRESPMRNNLAAYIDKNERLHVITRGGIHGVPDEHETVVADMIVRLIQEADGRDYGYR